MYDAFETIETVITPADVADVLNIGMNSVYKLLNSGKISAVRVGRVWRVPKRAVQEYILHEAKMKAAGWY